MLTLRREEHTDEMYAPTGIQGWNFLLQNFCSVYWTACSWNSSDENLSSVLFEHFFYSTPVGYFEGSNSWSYNDRVKTKETMTEDHRIGGGKVYWISVNPMIWENESNGHCLSCSFGGGGGDGAFCWNHHCHEDVVGNDCKDEVCIERRESREEQDG